VDILIYIVKLLVYMLLVAISGYVLVGSLISSGVSIQRKAAIDRLMGRSVKALLLAILIGISVQVISWTQQLQPEPSQLVTLLLEGSTGRVWLALLILSILFSMLGNKYVAFPFRLLLVFAMLLAESMNGHASGDSILILLDFVHLVAVSIWVGGVFWLWWNWRESSEQALTFIRKFTKLLWVTIVVVSLSGLLMLLLIVPSWSYLLYTSWGQLLLLKIATVLLTLWLGYKAKTFIHKHNQAKHEQNADVVSIRPVLTELGVLAMVIAFAAGVGMLSSSPSAANALNHHEMGEELHYTIKLTPNAPGPNQLSLSLWTLKDEGEVKEVELAIQSIDKQQAMPRVFQLETAELDDFYEFPGFNETRYTLDNLKLPYPSTWQVSFTVTFTSGSERQFSLQVEN
jgi:copper transport protein